MLELAAALRSAGDHLKADDPAAALAVLKRLLADATLSMMAITAVDRTVTAITQHPRAAESVPVRRVAVLCGKLSASMLTRTIRVALAAQGVAAVLHEGGYDGVELDVLDPGSELYAFKPDLVVVAQGWRDIAGLQGPLTGRAEADAIVDAEATRLGGVWATLRARLDGVQVVQHLFDRPATLLTGVAERRLPNGRWRVIEDLNRRLLDDAPGFVSFMDLDALSVKIGLDQWESPRDYHHAKLPFANAALPAYATAFGSLYRGLSARPYKVLVLDLDNTLWGGVIGDDGLDGIVFGQGDPVGEAHLAFAETAKDLQALGVTLAVSSKNDPELPTRVFSEGRKGMPIAFGDFAAFRCGWDDKPSNLRAIAAELNVGLDSLVFADDNPAECAIVREALPEVAVVQLDVEPFRFVQRLDALRLFDAQRLTQEDSLRAASYQAMREVAAATSGATDLAGFQRGLKMVADCRRAGPGDLARLAQLEVKTNQFNMTTRRLDAETIARAAEDRDAVLLALSLDDRLAKHGLVASLLARREGDALRIESWLMSCRVFSRTVEQFTMRRLIEEARAMGVGAIVGDYIPTERNGVVADLYERLGFAPDVEQAGRFRLDLADVDDDKLTTYVTEAEAAAVPDATVRRMESAA